eukprot:scaffold174108_cov19-Tisochrysis_lutea.AAC.1
MGPHGHTLEGVRFDFWGFAASRALDLRDLPPPPVPGLGGDLDEVRTHRSPRHAPPSFLSSRLVFFVSQPSRRR